MGLKFFSMFSRYDIKLMKNYIEFSEDNLKKYQDEVSMDYDSQTKGMSEEDKKDFDRFYEHHWVKSEFSYPSQMRKSIFLSNFAYLENQLNDICRYLQREENLLLNVEELKGGGLERFKVYLTKVLKKEFPLSQSQWQQMIQYRNLRNRIAHEYGDVFGDDRMDKNKVNQLKGIEFDGDKIHYTDQFNKCFVDLIHQVLLCFYRME